MLMVMLMLMLMLMVVMINGGGCNTDGDGKAHDKKYGKNDFYKNNRSYLFIVSTQERGS